MTQLLVIPQMALRAIEEAIVEATHVAANVAGERLQMSTIDHVRLASAARLALEIATGEVVWPGGEQIRIPKPREIRGVFQME